MVKNAIDKHHLNLSRESNQKAITYCDMRNEEREKVKIYNKPLKISVRILLGKNE